MTSEMQMKEDSTFLSKLSKGYYQELSMVIKEIMIGVLIGSFIMTFLPDNAFEVFFSYLNITNPFVLILISVLIGSLIAYLAFVCSVGNLVIASALWLSGLSLGGVLTFIFSDLITIPISNVYKKYYGKKMGNKITVLLAISAMITGFIIDVGFILFHIDVPVIGSMEKATFEFDTNFYLTVLFVVLAFPTYFYGKKLSPKMKM